MGARYELVEFDNNSHCKSWVANWPVSPEIKWHYHPEFELNCVIRSVGLEHVADQARRFEPGMVTLLGPNLPHTWQNDLRQPAGVENCEVLVVHFSREIFGDYFLDLPDNASLRQLLHAAQGGLYLPPEASRTVWRRMQALLDADPDLRLVRLLECLYELRSADGLSPMSSASRPPMQDLVFDVRIKTVVNYIQRHLCDEIVQADVANLLGMTPQGFSRFFKATTGQTFVAFVNALRIREACERLVNSNDAIIDIAFACGYNNLSNFNRQFIKLRGISPRFYRTTQRHKGVNRLTPRFTRF